jgi:hypothetical protein
VASQAKVLLHHLTMQELLEEQSYFFNESQLQSTHPQQNRSCMCPTFGHVYRIIPDLFALIYYRPFFALDVVTRCRRVEVCGMEEGSTAVFFTEASFFFEGTSPAKNEDSSIFFYT